MYYDLLCARAQTDICGYVRKLGRLYDNLACSFTTT